LLLVIQIANATRALVSNAFETAAPALIVVAFGLALVTNALQMWAWSILMEGLGLRMRWRDVVKGYSLSFLPRYIPGTVWGYLSRSEWLYQRHGITHSVANIGSLMEVAAILTANVWAIGIYFVTIVGPPYRVLLIGGGLFLVFGGWIASRGALNWPIVRRHLPRELSAQPPAGPSLTRWSGIILLLTCLWLAYGAMLRIAFAALNPLPFSIPPYAIIKFSAIYALGWLVGFLVIFVPAGLGFRELALSKLLTIALGTFSAQASAVSVLSRLLVALSEATWIGVGILIDSAPRGSTSSTSEK
jgi:hypothetical protein